MNFDFDQIIDRRKTESGKWRRYDPDVLPLWVADMDFISPPEVLQALHDRVEHGVFGYPMEMPELIEAIVERMAMLYQWHIQPEDVLLLPGVVTGFNLVCQALVPSSEGVLIQTPVYPPFLHVADNGGLIGQEMELTYTPQGYQIDFDDFEASITNKTRLFLLCNPHNPVGRVFRQKELERMAEICLRHQMIICSDEIHSDLIFSDHQHIPIASLSKEIAQNTVTLMAPSKTFNIAGLGCSYAIVQNQQLRKKLQTSTRGLVPHVNILGQIAALAAYQHGQPWLEELLVYLEANRDYLYEYICNELPDIKMIKPEGTYLAWLDCREANLPESPFDFFLRKARVALEDGTRFGKGGKGFTRLNFGCPRSILAEALERMRIALRSR
ncbi:MAG: PatB family C-S lyase [Anaerolineales bacterium]